MHAWLSNIGYISYVEHIILGDSENNDLFSHITLACENIIYNAMKADKKPHIQQVIRDIERMYNVERYKASLKRKEILCDKKFQSSL